MPNKTWSTADKALLKSDMTNEQIAKRIGRTPAAVKRMRYYYTGHSTEDRERITEQERMSAIEGECRILNLCKQLGVKLQGVR